MKSALSFKQTLFSPLPLELKEKIVSHLQGSNLEVIENETTPEQKEKVIALKSYHLMSDFDSEGQQTYFLGFAKKNVDGCMEYVKVPLNQKSAFYRVITQDPELISKLKQLKEDDPSLDRFIRHYLEEAVKAAGGIVKSHLVDRVQMVLVCQEAYALVHDPLKQELFQEFLFYVALGAQERAESILKGFPEFLLSTYKGDVKSVSEELMFHDATAFQLAVRNDDWHMYKMMLNHIPEGQQERFKTDLHGQLQALEAHGLSYTLDRLNLCGLRVLEANQQPNPEPTEAQIKEACDGNAYHLILHRDEKGRITQVELGFCHSVEGQYVRRPLSEGELQRFVLDLNHASFFQREKGFAHKVVRHKPLLRLAEVEINQLGGNTKISENKTLKDHIDLLLAAYQGYDRVRRTHVPLPALVEQWCVVVGRCQRLCFEAPLLAQYWMSPDIDRWQVQGASSFKGCLRPEGAPHFYDGISLFPFDASFADN